MNLALDVGNTQMHGGLFRGDALAADFRRSTHSGATEDEIGLFLLQILREWGCAPGDLETVGIASVVPSLTTALATAVRKYLEMEPFVLGPGKKTGLKIRTASPSEVGADRIAGCIGAMKRFPGENLIIIDLGTATTFDCLTADGAFLGGVIAPGLRLSMEALSRGTAQLPAVQIHSPGRALGRDTVTNIQAGLYYGHVGLVRELVPRLRAEAFGPEAPCRIVGTGGSVSLFDEEALFDECLPHLVLEGVRWAAHMNHYTSKHA